MKGVHEGAGACAVRAGHPERAAGAREAARFHDRGAGRPVAGRHLDRGGHRRFQLDVNHWALKRGGHARTGLEDNLYFEKGRLAASNAELVKRVADLCGKYDRHPAGADEARALLGLRPAASQSRGGISDFRKRRTASLARSSIQVMWCRPRFSMIDRLAVFVVRHVVAAAAGVAGAVEPRIVARHQSQDRDIGRRLQAGDLIGVLRGTAGPAGQHHAAKFMAGIIRRRQGAFAQAIEDDRRLIDPGQLAQLASTQP